MKLLKTIKLRSLFRKLPAQQKQLLDILPADLQEKVVAAQKRLIFIELKKNNRLILPAIAWMSFMLFLGLNKFIEFDIYFALTISALAFCICAALSFLLTNILVSRQYSLTAVAQILEKDFTLKDRLITLLYPTTGEMNAESQALIENQVNQKLSSADWQLLYPLFANIALHRWQRSLLLIPILILFFLFIDYLNRPELPVEYHQLKKILKEEKLTPAVEEKLETLVENLKKFEIKDPIIVENIESLKDELLEIGQDEQQAGEKAEDKKEQAKESRKASQQEDQSSDDTKSQESAQSKQDEKLDKKPTEEKSETGSKQSDSPKESEKSAENENSNKDSAEEQSSSSKQDQNPAEQEQQSASGEQNENSEQSQNPESGSRNQQAKDSKAQGNDKESTLDDANYGGKESQNKSESKSQDQSQEQSQDKSENSDGAQSDSEAQGADKQSAEGQNQDAAGESPADAKQSNQQESNSKDGAANSEDPQNSQAKKADPNTQKEGNSKLEKALNALQEKAEAQQNKGGADKKSNSENQNNKTQGDKKAEMGEQAQNDQNKNAPAKNNSVDQKEEKAEAADKNAQEGEVASPKDKNSALANSEDPKRNVAEARAQQELKQAGTGNDLKQSDQADLQQQGKGGNKIDPKNLKTEEVLLKADPQKSKFDNLGSGVGLGKGSEPSAYKVEQTSPKLGKPKITVDAGKQPVPLEYQDKIK